MKPLIRTLFLDIGGVLGTNGWDHALRKKAAENFGLDLAELENRHHLTFDTYEEGKITLNEYLNRVVFCEKRKFSPEEFKEFMLGESKPHSNVIHFFQSLKSAFHLRVLAVSNEGRELTEHRIKHFGLSALIDFFIVSSFVRIRKPDVDLYRIALDTAQVRPEEVVYIDDQELFVEVATNMGIKSIHHTHLESTRIKLDHLGLSL